VHTLCLPVAANLSDILYSADQQCIVGLLAKMGKVTFSSYSTSSKHLSFLCDSLKCSVFIFFHLFKSKEITEFIILAIECLRRVLSSNL